jgi:methionyl-tRNA formyltransferase
MRETKKFKIVVLSDSTSWINSTVEVLAADWKQLGHEVFWFHDLQELPPANFCFCLSFSKILKKEIRDRFDHTLVVHASDLPSGKGWSPLTWQILDGKNQIPVSLFEADDSVDSGSIYARRLIDFQGYELIDSLRKKLGDTTYELCSCFVAEYPRSSSQPKMQKGTESFYSRRGPKDSQLDVNKTIAEQFNLLRIVDNQAYPAFFEWKGRRFVLTITDEGLV